MRSHRHTLHHLHAPRPPAALKLERWHRLALYAVITVITLSGLLWLLAHYGLRKPGEFGEVVHPLEPLSMKWHGGSAMAALFLIGAALSIHIRRAIRAGRNLWLGWLLIGIFCALVVTGFGLYYLAGEASRPVWSLIHWAIGLALPLIFVLHIVQGRRNSGRG